MNIKNIIYSINEEIKQEFKDYKGLYFYGSRVKNSAKSGSDYDFLLVFENKLQWREKDKILDITYKYSLENDIVIDSKYYRYSDILNPKTPFRENVLNEGEFYEV